jgi:carbonic anhydrase
MAMHRPASVSTFIALLAALAAPALAAAAARWEYAGTHGPEHWGRLSAAWALCASGRNQSPVDLGGFVDATLPPVDFAYAASPGTTAHDGHTVQTSFTAAGAIEVAGHRFALRQVHFHAPSENHLAGRAFPLEAHLVHADAAGNLAVVAVFFAEGATNDALAALWQPLPAHAGEAHPLTAPFDPARLLPAARDAYWFSGSLTTPPCSEGVRWLVLKTPVTASPEQIETVRRALGHPNNRPLQPLYAREILE